MVTDAFKFLRVVIFPSITIVTLFSTMMNNREKLTITLYSQSILLLYHDEIHVYAEVSINGGNSYLNQLK